MLTMIYFKAHAKGPSVGTLDISLSLEVLFRVYGKKVSMLYTNRMLATTSELGSYISANFIGLCNLSSSTISFAISSKTSLVAFYEFFLDSSDSFGSNDFCLCTIASSAIPVMIKCTVRFYLIKFQPTISPYYPAIQL